MGKQKFHFCLSRGMELETMVVNINGIKYPLNQHDDSTRMLAARENRAISFLSETARDRITGYAEIERTQLNQNALSVITVEEYDGSGRLPVLHQFSYFIPERFHTLARQRRNKVRNSIIGTDRGLSPKLCFLEEDMDEMSVRLNAEDLDTVNRDSHYLLSDFDTAASILFMHGELGNSKPYTAAVVMDEAIMPDREMNPDQFYQMYLFAKVIEKQGPDHWAVRDVARDYKGEPILCQYDAAGYTAGEQIAIYQLSQDTLNAAGIPANGALQLAKNNVNLQNTNWKTSISHPVEYEYTQRNRAENSDGISWTADKKGSHHGLELVENSLKYVQNTLTVGIKNYYMRTLGAYAWFFDEAGKGIKNPDNWIEKLDPEVRSTYETSEKKYMGLVTPVNSIMGIPFPAQETKFLIPFPNEAVKVKLLFGTLGLYGYDSDIEINRQGAALTGVFQFAIPTILLAASTLLADGAILNDLMMSGVTIYLNIINAASGIDGTESIDAERVISILGDAIAGILLQHGAEKLLLYLTGMITVQQLEQQIPIVGWGLKIFNLTVGAASLAVTAAEMVSSPAALSICVTRKTDLYLTLHADPKHGEAGKPETAVWPLIADSYKILLSYEGSTSRELSGTVVKGNSPIQVKFQGIPAGGKCKVSANLYSKEDWLCGSWEGQWMVALPNTTRGIELDGAIEEKLIPLDCSTQYNLVYNKTYENERYCWRVKNEVPQATIDVLQQGGYEDGLSKLSCLSLNEAKQWMGYTYRACGKGLPPAGDAVVSGSKSLAQGVSKIGDGAVRSSLCEKGFHRDVLFALDRYGDGSDNYLLDTTDGVFNLRKIDLDKADFDLENSRKTNFGTFHLNSIDAMVVHPDRKVIAASWKQNMIEVIDLNKEEMDGIRTCGKGNRPGLLYGPQAMAVTADGRVLVLETTNGRIQAFDSTMNPTLCFTGEKLAEKLGGCMEELLEDTVPKEFLYKMSELGELWAGSCPVDDSIWTELRRLILSENLVQILTGLGIYPASAKDQQTGVWKYLSLVQMGAEEVWLLEDCCQNKKWKLIREGSMLSVERVMTDTKVLTVKEGQEWLIEDCEMTRGYRVTCSGENSSLVDVYRSISEIKLKGAVNTGWLDLAAEEKGYIYVLYYKNGGHHKEDYFVDIYTPDGIWLVTLPDIEKHPEQPHIVAGKLDVDHFRTLFAMHFENEPGNNGRREPKLTQWIPSVPK